MITNSGFLFEVFCGFWLLLVWFGDFVAVVLFCFDLLQYFAGLNYCLTKSLRLCPVAMNLEICVCVLTNSKC